MVSLSTSLLSSFFSIDIGEDVRARSVTGGTRVGSEGSNDFAGSAVPSSDFWARGEAGKGIMFGNGKWVGGEGKEDRLSMDLTESVWSFSRV